MDQRIKIEVNGFNFDETTGLYYKAEYSVLWKLDETAFADFQYWHHIQKHKGTVYPTLADFSTEYKEHRAEGVTSAPIIDDGRDPIQERINAMQFDLKRNNWHAYVPQAGKTFENGKVTWVVSDRNYEYGGNAYIQDSLTNFWREQLGVNGKEPSLEQWFESLQHSQKSLIDLKREKIKQLA